MIRNLLILWTLVASLTWIAQPAVASPSEGVEAHAPRTLMPSPTQDAALMAKEMGFTIVVFAIFFAVLSLVVWPKILGALKAREQKQEADMMTAESAAKEAQTTLAEYQQQLAEARKEAQQIIEQSKANAQQVAAQLKSQAELELTQMRERAQADIRSSQEQAIAAIYEEVANIATGVAGQILKRELDPAAHEALVSESLAQLSAGRN